MLLFQMRAGNSVSLLSVISIVYLDLLVSLTRGIIRGARNKSVRYHVKRTSYSSIYHASSAKDATLEVNILFFHSHVDGYTFCFSFDRGD